MISIISRCGLTVEACHRNQPNTVQPRKKSTFSCMPTQEIFYWHTLVALQVCHYYCYMTGSAVEQRINIDMPQPLDLLLFFIL